MNDITISPTWTGIHAMCATIHHNYTVVYQHPPDRIVGLIRGGLIPAVIMSHLFDVPLTPISYSSPVGNGESSTDEKLQPLVFESMNRNPIIFLIDDISDTGNTLSEIVDYYQSLRYDIITATLHYRHGSKFHPTFVGCAILESSPWVTYPWEI